jgi:PIN domain nuclease of toxin-antitoxin system
MIFFIINEFDEFDPVVVDILEDLTNRIYVSTESVLESLHLFTKGKIGSREFKTAAEFLSGIEDSRIEIRPLTEQHLWTYATLSIVPDVDPIDPTDHLIISQAISERIPLISSDPRFRKYIPQGLDLVYNQR